LVCFCKMNKFDKMLENKLTEGNYQLASQLVIFIYFVVFLVKMCDIRRISKPQTHLRKEKIRK